MPLRVLGSSSGGALTYASALLASEAFHLGGDSLETGIVVSGPGLGTPPLTALSARASGSGLLFLSGTGRSDGLAVSAASLDRFDAGRRIDLLELSAHVAFRSSAPAVVEAAPSGVVTALDRGGAWVDALTPTAAAEVFVSVDAERDSDGDGLPDEWEIRHGLDPDDPNDADSDEDSDGLSAREEFDYGSDPNDEDSDDDFLSDADEITFGTDPARADSDADGFLDGAEALASTDGNDPNDRPGAAFDPEFASRTNLSSDAAALAARSDDHVFVAMTSGRMRSYRIDRTSLAATFRDDELIGSPLRDIALDGTWVYSIGTGSLQIVDARSPGNLVRRETIGSLGDTVRVAAQGGLVAVLSTTALRFYRRDSVGDLAPAGVFAIPNGTHLALADEIAFVGIASTRRIDVIDVRGSGPVRRDRYSLSGAGQLRAIDATGPYVYVADGTGGLRALDATDPDALREVDRSSDDAPGLSANAVKVRGAQLLWHSAQRLGQVELYRLRDDGTFEFDASPTGNLEGAIAIDAAQEYSIALASRSFALTRVLPGGDRGVVAPNGELRARPSARYAVAGSTVELSAIAADGVYVEAVEFFANGELIRRDSIPPFATAVRTPDAPGIEVVYSAIAIDLGDNRGLVGALRIAIDNDLDGDGVPDAPDPDDDGDGVLDLEESLPGADGFVSDPRLVDTDEDGIDDREESTGGADGFVTDPSLVDTDGDGLRDADEVEITGTHPARADTDGDGTPDGAEDFDGDGLSVARELALGSDPRDPDSDDDGLLDGVEDGLSLDPLRTDSDGDGVPDAEEDSDGDSLSNEFEVAEGTHPGDANTDGDALDDGSELAAGTDPTAATDFAPLSLRFSGRTVLVFAPLRASALRLEGAILTAGRSLGGEFARVELEVDGTLSLDGASRIDVTGRGYRGGARDGRREIGGETAPGLAVGGALSGGAHAGVGGDGESGSAIPVLTAYGRLRDPSSFGAGGAADSALSRGGGNGGGAVKIRAGAFVLEGAIVADGELGDGAGAGAGGSIAVRVERLTGSGFARAEGGSTRRVGSERPGAGSGGRIHVVAAEAPAFDATRWRAAGGVLLDDRDDAARAGSAGTVLVEIGAAAGGELIVDGSGTARDRPGTLALGVESGTIAELGDDFIVQSEGEFPADVVGLEIDANSGDDRLDVVRILAVDGARIETTTGLRGVTEVGATFRGVLRPRELHLRGGGGLWTDDDVELPASDADWSAEDGALRAATLWRGSGPSLTLRDAGFDVRALRPIDGAVFDTVALTDLDLSVRDELACGRLTVERSELIVGGAIVAGDIDLIASRATVPEPSLGQFWPLTVVATGTIFIDAESALDAVAKGYLGGNRGGRAESAGVTSDHRVVEVGGRTGGSHGGLGGYQNDGPGLGRDASPPFGSFAAPVFPGGGGSGRIGSLETAYNGGGVIDLEARTIRIDGRISADGGGVEITERPGGAGAGGSVRISVRTIDGTGEISADGGNVNGFFGAGAGGGGRVAIEYLADDFSGEVHAYGGGLVPAVSKPSSIGGAGTVLWRSRFGRDDLVIDAGGRVAEGFRARLRPVGTGTIVALGERTLEGSFAFPATDSGVADHAVIIADAEAQAIAIVSNDAASLTTAGGIDLRTLGSPGDAYTGAFAVDTLSIVGGAAFSSSGDVIVVDRGGLTVDAASDLDAPRVVER